MVKRTKEEKKDAVKAWMFLFSCVLSGGIIAGIIVCMFLYIYWGI